MRSERFHALAAAALLAGFAAQADAAPILLDFEGLADQEQVGSFYNTVPRDFGVEFSDSVIALREFDGMSGSGDIENQPSGENVVYLLFDPSQSPDAMANSDAGNEATGILNFGAGFGGDFSFFYSASTDTAILPSVTVYDGLNGTGSALLSFELAQNWTMSPGDTEACDQTNGKYCNWDFVQGSIIGTALSAVFTGATNRFGIDDITINPVPLPAALWLLSSGLLGFAAFRRRRSTGCAPSAAGIG